MVRLAILAIAAALSGCQSIVPSGGSTTDCVNVGGLVFGGVSHCVTVNSAFKPDGSPAK